MRREYKLAADPIKPGGPLTWRREILQITDNGHREVFAVVANDSAIDVLEAIRRAYQDGREDNAPHWHSATGTEDTPCWCPTPGTYAPQGDGTYGSSEEEGQ